MEGVPSPIGIVQTKGSLAMDTELQQLREENGALRRDRARLEVTAC